MIQRIKNLAALQWNKVYDFNHWNYTVQCNNNWIARQQTKTKRRTPVLLLWLVVSAVSNVQQSITNIHFNDISILIHSVGSLQVYWGWNQPHGLSPAWSEKHVRVRPPFAAIHITKFIFIIALSRCCFPVVAFSTGNSCSRVVGQQHQRRLHFDDKRWVL